MANPSASHCIARKKTDHEAQRAKEVSASENMPIHFAIARFSRFKRLQPSKAFHGNFCAWLHCRVHQGSPSVSSEVYTSSGVVRRRAHDVSNLRMNQSLAYQRTPF